MLWIQPLSGFNSNSCFYQLPFVHEHVWASYFHIICNVLGDTCEPCIDQIWNIWNETKAGEMAYAPCPDIPDITPPITGKSWSQNNPNILHKICKINTETEEILVWCILVKSLGISECIENKGLTRKTKNIFYMSTVGFCEQEYPHFFVLNSWRR